MHKLALTLVVVVFGASVMLSAEVAGDGDHSLPDAPSTTARDSADSSAPLTLPETVATPAIIRVETPEPPRFRWQTATGQSMTLLFLQHGARMVQPKTRAQMGGPFLPDYAQSVNITGWRDGDGVLTNYVAHPMMGAITGYIEVQNDGQGITQEFSASSEYWTSRLRAMAWAAAYSTQFEIGPISEASIGNVGMKKGTSGWVDFIMTPTGGFGFMLAEDAVDRYLISRWESRSSPPRKRLFRMVLNPSRTVANLLRRKVPWHRDTRPMFPARSADDTQSAPVTNGAN